MNRSLLKPVLVIGVVLLVPIAPFLLFAEEFEPWIESLVTESRLGSNRVWVAGGIVGLLGADIFLPIPSSVLCTFAGSVLGIPGGTFAAWMGLNLSCWIGYFTARVFGWPLANRLSKPDELTAIKEYVDRIGSWTLLLFRAVPVLAEASVLLVGVYRMEPHRFWVPVLTANLGIAVAYAAFGQWSVAHGWLGLALAISFAFPATLIALWYLAYRGRGEQEDSQPGRARDSHLGSR